METTYLRSNLGDGTIPPQATVDDQMRALTRAFRETEAKYKVEAEETAKDLLRLTAELAKRDKAFGQLKQYCDEQQVLMETAKAQQAAELQRGHERRVAALKLVDTTQAEGDEARAEAARLAAANATLKDDARDAAVRRRLARGHRPLAWHPRTQFLRSSNTTSYHLHDSVTVDETTGVFLPHCISAGQKRVVPPSRPSDETASHTVRSSVERGPRGMDEWEQDD